MEEATIRFEGDAFHLGTWTDILRQLGFRLSDRTSQKALYVAGGSHVVAKEKGFATRDEKPGCEWQVILKQTRCWEGTIKFYAVLLAAFAVPQITLVTLSDKVFTDRDKLHTHAEAAIIREFSIDDLIDYGVYRKGGRIQFV